MKKVMWVFGKPGAGRKTLIKNILEDRLDVREPLEIQYASVVYSCIPDNSDSLAHDHSDEVRRVNSILEQVNNFNSDDNDVLLLNGEYSDYKNFDNSIINGISDQYKELKQELLLLSPEDLDVLYERLINTEWYLSKVPEQQRKYPREWLTFSVDYLRRGLQRFNDAGYTLYDIDTTDGYSFTRKLGKK